MSKLKTMGKRGLSLLLSFLMLFSLLPVTALAAAVNPKVVITPNNVQWNPTTGKVTGTVTIGVTGSGAAIGATTAVTIGLVSATTDASGRGGSDLKKVITSQSGWEAGNPGGTFDLPLPVYHGTINTSSGTATFDLGNFDFVISKNEVQTTLTTNSNYSKQEYDSVDYAIVVFFSQTAWNYGSTYINLPLADAPKYTVTYDANRGSVTPASAEVEQGQSVTLPAPTRSGYACTGWYTAASGGTLVGQPGASYTPAGDTTLYAQWKPVAVLTATPNKIEAAAKNVDGVGMQLTNKAGSCDAIIKSIAWKGGTPPSSATSSADIGAALGKDGENPISASNPITLAGGQTYGSADPFSSPFYITITAAGTNPAQGIVVVTYNNGAEDVTLEIPVTVAGSQAMVYFFEEGKVNLKAKTDGGDITYDNLPDTSDKHIGGTTYPTLKFTDSSGVTVVVANVTKINNLQKKNLKASSLALSASSNFNLGALGKTELVSVSGGTATDENIDGLSTTFTIAPKNANKACSEVITLTYTTANGAVTKTVSMTVEYEPAVHVAEKLPTPMAAASNTQGDKSNGSVTVTNFNDYPEDTKFTLYSDSTCTTVVSGPTTGSTFTGLDAGTYYIKATHDNTTDYLPSDAASVTVGKSPITVRLSSTSGSKTYDGSGVTLSGQFSVVEASGGATVPSGKYTVRYSNGATATDAGTYTATVTLTDTANYTFGTNTPTYTYTINKANLTVTTNPSGGKVGDSHNPAVTVTGVSGALTAGTDYDLGGWKDSGSNSVTLGAATPQGTYTNAIYLKGDAAANYNAPSAATYTVSAATHYTPTVTILVDGTVPTTGDIVSVGLGNASAASATQNTGANGVYTFASTTVATSYTHVHVTVHNDHKNGSASTTYILPKTVNSANKDAAVDLYTVRLAADADLTGFSSATVGGKGKNAYVIVPANTDVALAATANTGYRKDAWTQVGTGTINAAGTTFTSGAGAAVLTPHATALSQLQLLEGGSQRTSLSLSVVDGYAAQNILTAGSATSGGWVKNNWPRTVGKLTAVVNNSPTSHTVTTNPDGITATLSGTTTNIAQNGGVGITVNVPADLSRGSHTAYLWLYDDGADTALCAPVCIPITVNVATPEYVVSNSGNTAGVNSVTAKYTNNNSTYTLGTSKVSDGQSITVTAALASNYIFGGWEVTAGTGTFAAPYSATSIFTPTANATIRAKAIAQPNVSLATGTTISSSTQWNTVTTSTNVYSSTLSNTGAAAATNVTYALEDVGGGSAVSGQFDLVIAGLTSGGSLATGAANNKTVTIKPNTALAAQNYSFNLKITYEKDVLDPDKTDGSTKKETVTITRPISFSLAAASYTVDISVSPANSGTASATLNGSAFTSGGKVPENNVLAIAAAPKSGYEFVNWTVNNAANGSFANAASANTSFMPTADAAITANFRAIAILGLSNESKNNRADLTGLSTTTTAYQGTLKNSGALAATPTYKVQVWNGSAYADTDLFAVSGPASLAGGAGTANNLKITPKDAAAVTALKAAGAKTYELRVTVDYDKVAGTAATQIVSDNINFTVGKGYFDADVKVMLDGSAVNNATVSMKPSGTAVTATTNASGVASFTGTKLSTNTNYTLSVTVPFGGSTRTVTIGTVNRSEDATGDDAILVELYTVNASATGASATVSGSGVYKKGDDVTVSTSLPSGYDFQGWTGTGITTADTSATHTVANISQATTLTATFKPYYNLAYNVNGAAAAAPAGGKYYADDKFTVAGDITWAGRTFNGWYTAATGGTKITADGSQNFTAVFPSATPGSTTTLYAQWTASGVNYEGQNLTATYGVPFSADVAKATSSDTGDGTYITYTATGLPAGVTFAGGMISGRPQTVGSYPIEVTARDTRNGQTKKATWTLTVGKYTPSFLSAAISPKTGNPALNQATLYGTVTGPYWNGTAWNDTAQDKVTMRAGTKTEGQGSLSVTGPTPLTPAAQDYTMKYASGGTYAAVWADNTTELKGSSVDGVVGPGLMITPAIHQFTSDSPQAFTVTNNGSETAGKVDLTLDSTNFVFTNASGTEVAAPSFADLAAGTTQTIYVKPKTTAIGTHIAVLTATASAGKTATASLNYTVAAPTSYEATVNLKHVDTAGTATAADAAVVMRPVGSGSDIAGKKTVTGTYTWTTAGSNALAYGTLYQIMVDGQPSGQYVSKDTAGAVTVNRYQVALTQDPAAGATLTGAGYLLHGQSVGVSATTPTGYKFSKWTEGAADKSTAAAFTYIMPSDAAKGVTLTAHYAPVYGVTFDANGGTMTGSGQLANGPTFAVGETISINAPAADKYTISKTGYTFKGWAAASTATSGSYTAAMTGDGMTLYAVWEANALSAPGGEVKGTYGTALTPVTVTPPTGGSGTYTYAVSSGTLPSGVTLTGGKFTGTPTAATAAPATVTVKITDTVTGAETTVDYKIDIAKADPVVTAPSNITGAEVGHGYSAADLTTGNGAKAVGVRTEDNTGAGGTLPGAWTTAPNSVTAADGAQTVRVTYTPTDTANYNSWTGEITVTGAYKKITGLTLGGIATPAVGGTPTAVGSVTATNVTGDTGVSDDKVSVADLKWSPANSTFQSGTDYTAIVTLTPASGWQFDTAAIATGVTKAAGVDGTLTVLSATGDRLVCQVYYAAPKTINEVTVTTGTPSAGSDSTVLSPGGAYTVKSHTWTEKGTGKVVGQDGTIFQANTEYTLTVTLEPLAGSGYTFNLDASSGVKNPDHAKINNVNATQVTPGTWTETSVTISRDFTVPDKAIFGITTDAKLNTTTYYSKTDAHQANTVFGHKSGVGFAWSTAHTGTVTAYFVAVDGTRGEAVTEANLRLVYGDTAAAALDNFMPDEGYQFTNIGSNNDVAKYDGKKVYVQYTDGATKYVAPEPVGILTVKLLRADAITPSGYDVKLSYVKGDTFQMPAPALTAAVDFNTDVAALKNTKSDIPLKSGSAEGYILAVSDGAGGYTRVDGTTSVDALNGKDLYMVFTDVNNNTVAARLGTLRVAGDTEITADIYKGAAPVNDATNPAEYGDTLTAKVGGTPTGNLTYQWQVNNGGTWDDIAGADAPTYVPKKGDVGKEIKVVVTEAGKAGSAESAPVTVRARTVTFDVKSYSKNYDGNANNLHTTYGGADFTLSNVLGGDSVTLTYNAAAPNYSASAVGSTITWPAVTDATRGDYALSDAAYRLGTQSALPNKGVITSEEIGTIKITAPQPVAGSDLGDPSKTVSGDPYDLGTHTWTPNDAPAENSTAYQISVPVTPESGYTFSDGVKAEVTVGGTVYVGTVTRTDDTHATVSFTFPATAAPAGDVKVQHVDVHFANSPAYGDSIPSTPTGYSEATQTDLVDLGSGVTAQWYEGASATGTPVTGPFEANTTYTVAVKVKAKTGYAFDADTKFYFHFGAGETRAVTPTTEAGGVYVMTYTFPATKNPASNTHSVSAGDGSVFDYYVTTAQHTAANRATVPGDNGTYGFAFNATATGTVTLADGTVVNLAAGNYDLVAGDTPGAATTVLTAGSTFSDTALDGKNVYVRYKDAVNGDKVLTTSIGTLKVVRLRADSIEPTYAAGKSALDMLTYGKGAHFDSSAITAAGVTYNVPEGVNSTYTANQTGATAADYFFQVNKSGTWKTLTGSSTIGDGGADATDGDVLYICNTDVHGNTVRAAIGTLRTTAGSTASVTVKNVTTNTDNAVSASYSDALLAVVSGATGSLSYQWQRHNGTDWENITGATGPRYNADKGDIDTKVRVQVQELGRTGVATSQEVQVGKKTLTATFQADNKVYDGTTDATVRGTLSGAVSGDDVTLTGYTGAFANASVGAGKTVTITGAALSGGDAGYYTLAAPTDPTADITALAVSWNDLVFDVDTTKTYDGTTKVYKDGAEVAANQQIGGGHVSWAAGSTLPSEVKTAIEGALTFTFTYDHKNASVSAADPATKINVTVNGTVANLDVSALTAGTAIMPAVITPKTITVGVADLSAPSTTMGGSPGVTVNGSVTDNVRLESGDTKVDFTVAGAFRDTNTAGSGAVDILGVTPGSSAGITWTDRNYVLTWDGGTETTGNITGGEITKLDITGGGTATYGDAYGSVSGLAINVHYDNSEAVATTVRSFTALENLGYLALVRDYVNGSAEYYFATDAGKTVGWGQSSGSLNYRLVKKADGLTANSTLWNANSAYQGTITVEPKPITAVEAQWKLTAGGTDYTAKYYDGKTDARATDMWPNGTAEGTRGTGSVTLTPTGIINGDTVTVSFTGAEFADANVGTGKTITVSGLTLGGARAGRYKLTDGLTARTSGSIVARPIAVTFDRPSVQVGDPVTVYLSKQVSGVGGDTFTVTATGTYKANSGSDPFDGTNNVGTDFVDNVALSNVQCSNGNYAVTATVPGGSVTAKEIAIVAVTHTTPARGADPTADRYTKPQNYDSRAQVAIADNATSWFNANSGTDFSTNTAATLFSADEDYRVVTTVTANPGYVFTDNTIFNMNGGSKSAAGGSATNMKVTLDAGKTTATVEYIFHVPAGSKEIARIAIDVVPPIATKALDAAAGTANDLLIRSEDGEDLTEGLTISSVTWRDETANTAVTPGSTVIQTSHNYSATFTVTAKGGYTLKSSADDSVDFLINGVLDGDEWIDGAGAAAMGNVAVETTAGGNTNTYTVKVTFTDVGTTADVLVVWGLADEPEAGTAILNTALRLKVATQQPYEIIEYDAKTLWKHWNETIGDWEEVHGSANFLPGHKYQAVISVQLKDAMKGYGYAFTTDTAGFINDTEPGQTTVRYLDESGAEVTAARAAGDVAVIELKREFTVPKAQVYVQVKSDIPTAGGNVAAVNGSIGKPAGADTGYTLADGKWCTDTAGTAATEFIEGNIYYLVVTVTPDTGYELPTATNGYYWNDAQTNAVADSNLTKTGSTAIFRYRIPITSAGTAAMVYIDPAKVAKNLPTSGAPATSENNSVDVDDASTRWTDAGGAPATTFQAGKTYTATVVIKPTDAANYPVGTEIYFNGVKKTVEERELEDGTKEHFISMNFTIPADPPPSGGGTVIKEVPVVSYWLGKYGATDDLTVEKVSEGGKPENPPKITWIQAGYAFVGWTDTPYEDGQKPTLVDPKSVTVTKDITFYAVYEKRATDKHEHYVKGYENGLFLPLGNITRAEVATIIARSCLRGYVEGANYGNAGLTDVDDHWARSAIAFCALSGILTGYTDGTFQPNAPITRQEFAVAMSKMAGVQKSQGLDFKDAHLVADWAEDAVYTCVVNGWVSGYTDGNFSPTTNLLRAEAVKIMNGYLKRKVDPKSLSEILDLLKIFPDVPQNYWAYYEILEAANDHDYYLTGEDGNSLPEHWTNAYVGDVSWGS